MTLSEIHRRTGLKCSIRQFQRYAAKGLFRGVTKGKGGHFYTTGPITEGRLETIAKIVREQQRSQRERSGITRRGHRYNNLNAPDKSAGFVNIEGISLQFAMWFRKVSHKSSGFYERWDPRRRQHVEDLLTPMAQCHKALVELRQLEEINPPKDPTYFFQKPSRITPPKRRS